VLLYGPPGTGKTMLAKVIGAYSLTFLIGAFTSPHPLTGNPNLWDDPELAALCLPSPRTPSSLSAVSFSLCSHSSSRHRKETVRTVARALCRLSALIPCLMSLCHPPWAAHGVCTWALPKKTPPFLLPCGLPMWSGRALPHTMVYTPQSGHALATVMACPDSSSGCSLTGAYRA